MTPFDPISYIVTTAIGLKLGQIYQQRKLKTKLQSEGLNSEAIPDGHFVLPAGSGAIKIDVKIPSGAKILVSGPQGNYYNNIELCKDGFIYKVNVTSYERSTYNEDKKFKFWIVNPQ